MDVRSEDERRTLIEVIYWWIKGRVKKMSGRGKNDLKSHYFFHMYIILISFCILSTIPIITLCDNGNAGYIEKETQITSDGHNQRAYDLYEDLIVFLDDRNGYDNVYLLNLSSGEEKRITNVTNNTNLIRLPEIFGQYIVWEEDRMNLPLNLDSIFYYDIIKNETFCITRNTSSSPSIHENMIVWEDRRDENNTDIYSYDISTGFEERITDNLSYQGECKIWKDRIVWEDRRNGNRDIYMYDLETGKETQITDNASDQRYPRIWGNIIAWTDERNGKENDIYYYNIEQKKEVYISNISNIIETQGLLDIYEDKILLSAFSNISYSSDIFLYDIVSDSSIQITCDDEWQSNPAAFYEDIIVWSDRRNGNYDIFSYIRILDSDDDGIGDKDDAFPFDPTEWLDTDMDGYGDNRDAFPTDPTEWNDTDDDGWGDNRDRFPNDPLEWNDTDSDGFGDNSDQFPDDPLEWNDTDNDGYGDNGDRFPDDPLEWNDIDNDGVGDDSDLFPADPGEWNDTDGDGTGDNGDRFPMDPNEWNDTDNDGHGDNHDRFPDDPTEWSDTDQDGYGDNGDRFPTDPDEWVDSDGDGVGDNGDRFPFDAMEWNDKDNDGWGDNGDRFPQDPLEWNDTDNDGYGDNRDLFPDNMLEWNDTDADGWGDNGDVFPLNTNEWNDTDDDGVGDNSDAFPTDPAASVDTDDDGYPDRWNDGKSEKDSTTGLVLDEYPDDPDRFEKENGGKYPATVMIIIGAVVFLLVIGLVLLVLNRKRNEKEHVKEE